VGLVKKYREKVCPQCGIKHNKRGPYCSRSCGNKKKHTEETKQLLSKRQTEWLTSGTDKAEVAKHNYLSKRENGDPDPIAPITRRDNLENNQFVQDGDIWTEI
jgi:hypothetical protein